MKKNEAAIRIGEINYTNVWPIFFNMNRELSDVNLEFVSQVPAQLNREMAAGRVDMGPISSFSYAEHCEEYVLMPELSVSSYGRVNSILLFHRQPLEELRQASIALPNTSASSVTLLKIILARFYDADPTYTTFPPVLPEMMEVSDAALLIGDHAIRANWEYGQDYYVTDLGQIWKEKTGCWMSFAVWAIREQIVREHADEVHAIYRAFCDSKQMSLSNPMPLAIAAQEKIGGDVAFWLSYFSQLHYDFGPEQQKGLELYFKYAYEYGALSKPAEIRIWSNNLIT